MSTENDRVIRLAGIGNLRDLGGYPVEGGGATRWRSVLRSGRLPVGDPRATAALLDMGLATVVDLRGPKELSVEPNPFDGASGVRYRNVPLFGALSPIAVARADGNAFDLAARYRDAVDQCRETIAEALSTIAAATDDGVLLFHCSAGKDRTGIIAALLLSLAGVDRETVVGDYALTASVAGPLLASLREEGIARGADPALVDEYLSCPPETMRSLLAHLDEAYGGVETYVSGIGLGTPEVSRLRVRLRDGT